ncbi:MAG: DNA repair protein RadC [Lachnospiraceae bacterium]
MNKHLTVKELPVSERPYEKFKERGAEYLTDAELLAIIIRTGSKQIKSIELAEQILSIRQQGILNLYELSFEELQQIYGIGEVKAIQLKSIAELSRRICRESRRKDLVLQNARSVAFYYMETLCHESKEHLLLSCFDSKCRLCGDSLISVGTVNASLVSPREIFMEALKKKAVYVILLHNHPSGDPTPSAEDIEVTRRIFTCGQLLEIPLSDHIIIGDHKYFSFREKGLLNSPKGDCT